jgi:hypothetical protein
MARRPPRIRDRWVQDLAEERNARDIRDQRGRKDLNQDRGTQDVLEDPGERDLDELGVGKGGASDLLPATSISGGYAAQSAVRKRHRPREGPASTK